ncbi:Hypothetical protein MVR_LOCUS416 [uncultured virus]|nr:Hypothetical protein MVR_LOCUS416 [uncultured virus]
MQDSSVLPKYILTHIVAYCDIMTLASLAGSSKSMSNIANAISKQFCIGTKPHVFDQIAHLNINWVYVHYCLLNEMPKTTKYSVYGFLIRGDSFILGRIIDGKLVGLGISHHEHITIASYHDVVLDAAERERYEKYCVLVMVWNHNRTTFLSMLDDNDPACIGLFDGIERATFDYLRKQTGKQVNS